MKSWIVLSCILLLIPTAGSAGTPEIPRVSLLDVLQGDTELPEEWQGVWTVNSVVRDCSTNGILVETTTSDTLCAGDSYGIDDPGDEVSLACTGTATATTIDMTCTGDIEIFPGCTQMMVVDFDATFGVNSYTGTAESNVTFSGAECPPGLSSFCSRSTITGTRVGPAPPGACALVPVEPITWGRLKSARHD